ncbi:DUF5666 domain-containing protein [Mycobacterium nebraskense]|uniref:DUF5666 domain-containing protein n=1 Tax=Mycobacterium nebraskense TaxID=244292 RepID=A0A1X1ZAP4_9MYCO|nr:DUF5666 domain-containing protein [Mycobacterium nebraskense]KKB97376.1 hypothetical protein WU83_31415 [Mycobacterium nebraskense]MBI2694424.1 hypothetical protein [Mycobacterium nebraskense]MCV7115990.1 hypothetical protein [Mycobacterium nebraskense]ORW20348.1 hypothetical protein AWC17_08100 [Mycobacterium nebraskense]
MPATSVNSRLARLALVAVLAVVLLGVAMCRSSDTNSSIPAKPTVTAAPPSPAPSAAPAPAAPPVGKDYVEGLIESVSGGTIALRTRTGSATVDFAPSTRVVRVAPATLTDVTPGSCVNVRATPQSAPNGGAITAQSVTITSAVDGKCPPPAGFYGTVTSVSGDTIAVNGIGVQAAPTNVTVANSTSYQLQNPSDAHAIANGKCMGAQGIQDAGVLHAAMISLQACPPMGHPHHHLHLPHLPFRL